MSGAWSVHIVRGAVPLIRAAIALRELDAHLRDPSFGRGYDGQPVQVRLGRSLYDVHPLSWSAVLAPATAGGWNVCTLVPESGRQKDASA